MRGFGGHKLGSRVDLGLVHDRRPQHGQLDLLHCGIKIQGNVGHLIHESMYDHLIMYGDGDPATLPFFLAPATRVLHLEVP